MRPAAPTFTKWLASAAAALLISLGGLVAEGEAGSPVKLRVGNPDADSFFFLPLAIGREQGIFTKNGIDLEVVTFEGSERLEEALAKGIVEIALGSGTELAFIPKGAPSTAVATLAVRPSLLVVSTRAGSPVKAVNDLKGKVIGVTAADPVPAWLVRSLSESRGWGPDGIKALPLDDELVSDGKINPKAESIVAELPAALDLEARNTGRTIVNFGDVVRDFPFYMIFARNDLISQSPDTLKAFLAGWFETVKWMGSHRVDVGKRVAGQMHATESMATQIYDKLMPTYSSNGKFDAKALATLGKALVTMKVLDREQDLRQYVTEKLLSTSCSN